PSRAWVASVQNEPWYPVQTVHNRTTKTGLNKIKKSGRNVRRMAGFLAHALSSLNAIHFVFVSRGLPGGGPRLGGAAGRGGRGRADDRGRAGARAADRGAGDRRPA